MDGRELFPGGGGVGDIQNTSVGGLRVNTAVGIPSKRDLVMFGPGCCHGELVDLSVFGPHDQGRGTQETSRANSQYCLEKKS